MTSKTALTANTHTNTEYPPHHESNRRQWGMWTELTTIYWILRSQRNQHSIDIYSWLEIEAGSRLF